MATWQPSWNSLNSISSQTTQFNWAKTLVGGYGEHGVLVLTLWLCSGILYGSHFEILQIPSQKPCCFEQYFCGRHLGNMGVTFCKRIYGHHGSHNEIHKITSRPWVANRPPPFMGHLVNSDYLKLHYITRKLTHDSPFAVGTFTA